MLSCVLFRTYTEGACRAPGSAGLGAQNSPASVFLEGAGDVSVTNQRESDFRKGPLRKCGCDLEKSKPRRREARGFQAQGHQDPAVGWGRGWGGVPGAVRGPMGLTKEAVRTPLGGSVAVR